MTSARALASIRPGSLIAGRYTVDHALGKGGMGSVYAVREVATGRALALKYLQREAALEKGPAAALFQREYHTLAHLKHPRVIQVFDYGVDADRPFYTMELLDGSDMRELAPVPWQRACRLLRDVGSSLALLHSRRLLHRDVSPRNVRCTRDGQAKLIDFGAMTPMGIARDVAGTPPYMAPEALNGQVLDARTDLFSLGALAYWTLSGHDAYPARDTRELRALWARPVVPPSTLARGIPEALDALVMSLLSLDAQARPSHVAEVLERLTAIGGLEPIEHLDVARAYLVAPSLVGHVEALTAFHKRLVRASRGRGSGVLIEGAPGVGRTRLLQALVLEAKLSGVLVLGADARTPHRGELGCVRSLLESLISAAPELALETFAPYAPVLGHLVPEMLARLPHRPELSPLRERSDRLAVLDQAARDWLLAVAQRKPLMIAVDDIDRVDEPSLVCVALLAREAAQHKLTVCVSAEQAEHPRALAVLSEGATRHRIEPLSRTQSERLLRSVFGDASNLQVVAAWVHALSQGNPRTIMELAQYLVDHRVARYERGSWILPESLRGQALPASVEQALEMVVARLSACARGVAEALSLAAEHGPLSLSEVARLCGTSTQEAFSALEELHAVDALEQSGERFALRRRGLERLLAQGVPAPRRTEISLALSRLYAERAQLPGEEGGDQALLLAALHAHAGGDIDAAVDALTRLSAAELPLVGRTPEATAMLTAALEHAAASGLTPAALYPLRRTAMQLASLFADTRMVRHAHAALSQLAVECGYQVYARLTPAELQDPQRIQAVFAKARARHEATPAELRGLEPARALSELGYAASVLTSAHAARGEADELRPLAKLIEPLAHAFPAFGLLREIIEQSLHVLQGADVLDRRKRTLATLEARATSLDPMARLSARAALTYWIGIDEACLGQASSLERAGWLESQPAYAALGARVRGVYHLFMGNEQHAEDYRRQREILVLGDQWGLTLADARGAPYEAWGYYLCGSVLGMRRSLATVTELAARFSGWQRELHLVRGLYELLRGEPLRALPDLARSGVPGAHALGLRAAGDVEQAVTVATNALADTQASLHPVHAYTLRAARALALSDRGDALQAARLLDEDIVMAERSGLQGMLLCMLYEARTRVAIALEDRAAFRSHIRKLGATYSRGTSGLRARYEHLGVVARGALLSLPPPPPDHVTVAEELDAPRSTLALAGSAAQRLQRALELVAGEAGTQRGHLFGMSSGGLRLSASLGDGPPPEGLEDMLAFYLNAELDSGSAVPHTITGTFTSSPDLVAWINDGQHLYFPVLLACTLNEQRMIAGVAVLALATQEEPAVSGELIAEISQCLIEAGDVVGAKGAD